MSQTYKLLVLPGDHVGPEVVAEALKVLDVVEASRPGLKFERDFDLAGGASIDKHGVPITEAVLAKAEASDAVLFGSIGGPEWAGAVPTPESGLLALRRRLDAFANIRPCAFYAPSLVKQSPIKEHLVKGTHFVVVRENCGGAYFGDKREDADVASDLWEYKTPEIERLAHVSAAVARLMGRPEDRSKAAKVWSADKYNVLANSRLWRTVTQRVLDAPAYADIDLQHQLADSMAMLMVAQPTRFNGVIHTDNTFGDILSDIAGGITGTLGVLPSASISAVPGGDGRCNGIYEPVHGSAPDISGKGLVNPVAQILSVAMMLRYSFLLAAEADAIEKAVSIVLEEKAAGGLEIRTADLGGKATTRDVGEAVCSELKKLLSK
ncbi:3-isopropylmalate dehydrogenase [Sporothrix brasiliensis 5110]|uniref:3-isopropylmalate dehydrogenase n=1 Tax=Sporothrix brasiliensis 5110 TaxID=1398154 RepID=A0A0C2FV14_9PEZI|nr:3-isopropylmalate dehydrogenase [Sporothrix brasiliensis 5110]KIH94883.1 3-isopropylmalate dehydrogenase [Sporothrix brasiliensis 5110]